MVWFTLILWATTFILSYVLRPKVEQEAVKASKITALRFPRATSGAPLPVIFGKVRVRSPNTIWFGNFKALPVYTYVKTGLFDGSNQLTGYHYGVSMDLAVCAGPDVTLHRIWAGKQLLAQPGGGLNGDGVSMVIQQSGLFGGPTKGGGMAGNTQW